MNLNNFYKLKNNFILLGLKDKIHSGSDLIVKLLSQEKLTILKSLKSSLLDQDFKGGLSK